MEATKNDWNLEPWTLDPGTWNLEQHHPPGIVLNALKAPHLKLLNVRSIALITRGNWFGL